MFKKGGGYAMARLQKNPSRNGVSAASVKGNAGPHGRDNTGKQKSQNQQYKQENTQGH